ncbi:MAG: hypothetical protein IKJ18_00815 [Bacteroidaceae bacterium]|nr:hypothetical protein [Bacteroidaceae bacterium]
MKKFMVMAALMVATLTVSAQEYNWAVGVRGGAFNGLTAKKNNGSNALEFGASWSLGNHLRVDGVYEWQQPVITEGFNLYYGAGAFLGINGGNFGVGAEAVVGLEYKIANIPLAFSLDYRPALDILDLGDMLNFYNFGFGIKYCF